MALTEEQTDIVEAKISSLHRDIGGLTEAKQEVYDDDDLEELDNLHTEQYESYDDEIVCWIGERGYLSGEKLAPNDPVVQADIDAAVQGLGRLFPIDTTEVMSPRITGETDGSSELVDVNSNFNTIQIGDILSTDLYGIFPIQNILDVNSIEVTGVIPIDIALSYSVYRNLPAINVLSRPYVIPGLLNGTGWESETEEIHIAIEQPLLSWFYFPVPIISHPSYATYVENVDAFAESLDFEISSLQGQLDAWFDGGGYKYSFDTTQAYADIVAALANANAFKSAMDIDGSGTIDIDDFKGPTAPTVMPPLLSARDTFLTGTRTPQVDNRKTEIADALGEIIESGEEYSGSGLFVSRYTFLCLSIDRTNGTHTELENRGSNIGAIDEQIAYTERQIEEYQKLLL